MASPDLGFSVMTRVTACILILCAAGLIALAGAFAIGWAL